MNSDIRYKNYFPLFCGVDDNTNPKIQKFAEIFIHFYKIRPS